MEIIQEDNGYRIVKIQEFNDGSEKISRSKLYTLEEINIFLDSSIKTENFKKNKFIKNKELIENKIKMCEENIVQLQAKKLK